MANRTNGFAASRIPPARKPSESGGSLQSAMWGRLGDFICGIYRSDRGLQLTLLVFMLLWYSALCGISLRLLIVDPQRLTFNSMLDHMLHGRFDVDPRVVNSEGYLRNGRVYSYFGVWCALLRLPLWIIRRPNVDMTFASCVTAACVAGMAKVRAVILIRHRAIGNATAKWAIGLMLAYVVLAGSAVAYLIDSVWSEVMLWAYAFAAVFVYFALKGIVNRYFDSRSLCLMASCAGLALLTRVSTGVGLIFTFVLLLLALAFRPGRRDDMGQIPANVHPSRASTLYRKLVPLSILGLFVGASGTVNYFRWGNPAIFVNYDLYLLRNGWPNFVSSLHDYGAFNLKRIPFGLNYYFLPVWVLHDGNGHLLLENTQMRLLGVIDLPPSSFLLTDLFPFCFVVLLAIAIWRRRARGLPAVGHWAAAIAIGLQVPCILMLSLAWMVYRYRLEFYPEIEFLAFLGLYLTVTDGPMLARFARVRRWLTAGLAVSVFASIMALALVNLSGDDLPQVLLRPGVVQYYRSQFTFHLHHTITRDFGDRP
jgi:hypothetical protein